MYFASGVVQLTLMKRILNLVKEQRVPQVLCGLLCPDWGLRWPVSLFDVVCISLSQRAGLDRGIYRRCCHWEMCCQHPRHSARLKDKETLKKKKKITCEEFYFFLWLKRKGLETKGVTAPEPGSYLARSRHIFGWGVCSCSHWARKYNDLTELEFLSALPGSHSRELI